MGTHIPHATRCAEDIALLYLLHTNPTLPDSNHIDPSRIRTDGYTLSFDRERRLTHTLAFLSNTEDNPNLIPAVCVEENSETTSLSVLLAVNKLKPHDGHQLQQQLKRDFERIFAILAQISSGRTVSNVEHDVFAAIISMCSTRILRRLRFVNRRKNVTRQPIKNILQEAINALRQIKRNTFGKLLPVAASFEERAREVVKLVDSWTKHQTQARLEELVRGMHRLREIEQLHALLDMIPNQAMSPSARANLLNIVRKVARYREASRFLYRTAKKNHLVRNMEVVLVNLPSEAFQRIPTNQYNSTLQSTMARVSEPDEHLDLRYICRLLKTTEPEAETLFSQQTTKTINEAKIHAEIQLLFHCDMNPSRSPPRVVCSSKDACFLCNMFILLHGKMHMPRQHGRIYPGWRMPNLPNLNDIEGKFNAMLEVRIRESLRMLIRRRQRTTYPDPLESTLLTLPLSFSTSSSSTLNSLPLLEDIVEGDRESIQSSPEDDIAPACHSAGPSIPQVASVPSSIRPTEASSSGTLEHVKLQSPNHLQPTSPVLSSSQASSSGSSINDDSQLSQGLILSRSIEAGNASQLYSAGSFEVQIENSHSSSSYSTPRRLHYSIEWLREEEVKRLQDNKAIPVIDVESLEGEITHEIDELNHIHMAARGRVFKILLNLGIFESQAHGR